MKPGGTRTLAGLALLGLALVAGMAMVGSRRWPTPASAEPRDFELTIRGGALAEGSRVVRVRQGDDVTLRWTTDRPLAIHLHGYDLEAKLTPGTPVTMHIAARATGRFPIEVHGHGSERERTIGYLEVHPR